jgi:hypothetical protein
MNILDHVPVVPDWPKPGINFFDITGILANADAFDYCCEWLEAISCSGAIILYLKVKRTTVTLETCDASLLISLRSSMDYFINTLTD